MEELHKIEPTLLGAASKPEVSLEELNTAATLAALSIKLMDVTSNVYQIHSTLVRLGQNVDMTYNTAQSALNELKGRISELDMRVSDLEVFKGRELSDNGDNYGRKSKGRKRLLSSTLGLLGVLLSLIPGVNTAALLTEILAGSIGVVGLGHAVREKTITKRKLTSLAALCAALLAVAPYIPALAPYVPAIEGILATLATLGIGNEVKTKIKKQ